MVQSRRIAWPAYLLSAALIIFPLSDTLTSLYPWNIGDARWRFGAVGLLSSALLIPMLGLLLAILTAWALDQRLARRVLAILSLVAATVCVVALVSFALDAVQTRAAVRPEMQLSFKVAATTAAIKTLLAATILAVLGIASIKGSGAASRASREVPLFTTGSRPTHP